MSPSGSSFKKRVSGLFCSVEKLQKGFNTGHPETHSREEARQKGRSRRSREVVVFDGQMTGMLTPWFDEP